MVGLFGPHWGTYAPGTNFPQLQGSNVFVEIIPEPTSICAALRSMVHCIDKHILVVII